jgi:CheY-like chemotaxis protein
VFALFGNVASPFALLAQPHRGPRERVAATTAIDIAGLGVVTGFLYSHFVTAPDSPGNAGPVWGSLTSSRTRASRKSRKERPVSNVVQSLQSFLGARGLPMFKESEPTPPRILIVDDESSVREFLVRVLREAGYDIAVAESGADALAVANQAEGFDLLLTDLMMPHMRGDELARMMRQQQPQLKVLYLTGYSDSLFAEKAMLWTDEAFLEKPCTLKGLLEAVTLLMCGRIK